MPKPTETRERPTLKDGTWTTGFCQSEEQIRTGVMASTASAEHFHRLCPGTLVSRNGQSMTCRCPHHEGEDAREVGLPCLDCGDPYADAPKKLVYGRTVCADREACAANLAEKAATNPAYARLVDARTEEADRKAEIKRLESEGGGATPARPKVGRCEFSGTPTKGGRFFPGNDAKLKSILLTRARNGDVACLTELLYRGWVKEQRPDDPYPFWDKAFAAARDHDTADDKFQERLAARWARIESEATPEEAV